MGLFALGGVPLGYVLKRGAARALWHYYLPLLNRVDRALVLDDTTQTGLLRALAMRSPECDLQMLPVPHGPIESTGNNPRDDSDRRTFGVAPGSALIGWAGRLDPLKAPEDFLALANCFAGSGDIEFVLAGPSNDELLHRFGRLPPNVRALGRLDRRQLHRFLTACDLVTLTSKLSVMGTIGREAFALGCLVAAMHDGTDYLLNAIDQGDHSFLALRRGAHSHNAQILKRALAASDHWRGAMRERAKLAIARRGMTISEFSPLAARFLLEGTATPPQVGPLIGTSPPATAPW